MRVISIPIWPVARTHSGEPSIVSPHLPGTVHPAGLRWAGHSPSFPTIHITLEVFYDPHCHLVSQRNFGWLSLRGRFNLSPAKPKQTTSTQCHQWTGQRTSCWPRAAAPRTTCRGIGRLQDTRQRRRLCVHITPRCRNGKLFCARGQASGLPPCTRTERGRWPGPEWWPAAT